MINPTGMTIPQCECWKKKPKAMDNVIDKIASLLMLEALSDAKSINLCPIARDYYIAAIIFHFVSALVVRRADDNDWKTNPIASYRQDFENVYDRLRPLVMQRIDYADAVVDEMKEG